MASHPPSSKCCTVGTLHEGQAKGEFTKLGGGNLDLPLHPPTKSSTRALLLLTDAFGHEFLNAQLLADQFAANGYLVAVPDLFAGDAAPLNPPATFDFMKWLEKHMPEHIDPIVDAVVDELRESRGVKSLGAVGYCFGGKYVARHLKKGKIDVGFAAHPSFVGSEELEGIQGPLSISAAVKDGIFTAEKRRETEDILNKLDIPYQLNLFSDVEHGFAVRCNLSLPRQKFAKESAFFQALYWFNEYLK